MNENVILDKILIEADSEAEKIIDDAHKEISSIKHELKNYENSLDSKLTLEVEKYKKESEEFYLGNLEFNKSKLVLEAKNELLEELKETAISQIKSYKNAEMVEFLNKILLKNAENNETLLFNINGIKKGDLEKLDIVKTLNLTIVEDKKIDEGLVLTTDTYDKNLSFESIVNDLFNQKRNEICNVLF